MKENTKNLEEEVTGNERNQGRLNRNSLEEEVTESKLSREKSRKNSLIGEVTEDPNNQGKLKRNSLIVGVIKKKKCLEEEVTKGRSSQQGEAVEKTVIRKDWLGIKGRLKGTLN